MWRFFAGAGAALLLATAGFFLWSGRANGDGEQIPDAPAAAGAAGGSAGAPRQPPSADERTREQRRFDRADRDNDGRVTVAEMTYGRRRNYDRLDTNHDGRLSFEEWAARTLRKFAEVDANHDQALSRAEFAATAPPQRRTAARRQNCDCARQAAAGSGAARGRPANR